MDIDMIRAEWFCTKVQANDYYAQNLYAAMCNMQWQKLEIMPILKDEYWSASWRHSGGIVADIIGKGDYMDWYCSGMGGVAALDDEDEDKIEQDFKYKNYVSEGVVTEEILADLFKLGWQPIPYPEYK
jgi:hypothetical protein